MGRAFLRTQAGIRLRPRRFAHLAREDAAAFQNLRQAVSKTVISPRGLPRGGARRSSAGLSAGLQGHHHLPGRLAQRAGVNIGGVKKVERGGQARPRGRVPKNIVPRPRPAVSMGDTERSDRLRKPVYHGQLRRERHLRGVTNTGRGADAPPSPRQRRGLCRWLCAADWISRHHQQLKGIAARPPSGSGAGWSPPAPTPSPRPSRRAEGRFQGGRSGAPALRPPVPGGDGETRQDLPRVRRAPFF